jgi:lipopolysaccharide export system permease protein
MKIIDRYIGKEIAVTSLFAVAVLSLVLVLGNVFKRLLDLLVNHDVPLEYILSFIGYILPFSLTFTIPWGFLTAVLLVFGRLSAENELIALRSSGVSIPRICASVAAFALLCTGLCFWINVDVAPKAQQKMQNALFHIATSNPIAMFGSDQVIDEFPGKKIYVERKEGNQLFNILVYELDDDSEPVRVIQASRGQLEADLENHQIIMHLNDLRYEERDHSAPGDLARIRQGITMKEVPFPISLEELYQKNKKRRGLAQMTLKELVNVKDEAQRSASRTEANKRFSFSLASFAFALVGVPLAITAHRKETSVGFLFSLLVAFVYFFFIIIADTVRKNPHLHPELLIWVPNVLFITLGSFLFYRLACR